MGPPMGMDGKGGKGYAPANGFGQKGQGKGGPKGGAPVPGGKGGKGAGPSDGVPRGRGEAGPVYPWSN